MLGEAIAHLHWAPDTFWACTLHEFYAACEALEPKKRNPDEPSPEFAALRDAHLAKEAAAKEK